MVAFIPQEKGSEAHYKKIHITTPRTDINSEDNISLR